MPSRTRSEIFYFTALRQIKEEGTYEDEYRNFLLFISNISYIFLFPFLWLVLYHGFLPRATSNVLLVSFFPSSHWLHSDLRSIQWHLLKFISQKWFHLAVIKFGEKPFTLNNKLKMKDALEHDKYSPVKNYRTTLQLEIISIFFLF